MEKYYELTDRSLPSNAVADCAKTIIRAAFALPQLVMPMANRLAEEHRGFVVACDRNARPIGYALQGIFEGRNRQVPSVDGRVHFYKVTARVSTQMLANHLAPFFDLVKEQEAGQRHITVVDDHMSKGATKLAFTRACSAAELGVQVTWMTVTGKGADFSIAPHMKPSALMSWQDRPDILGIDYTDNLELRKTPTPLSEQFYEAVAAGVGPAVARYVTIEDSASIPI